jgi:hypothetical protein
MNTLLLLRAGAAAAGPAKGFATAALGADENTLKPRKPPRAWLGSLMSTIVQANAAAAANRDTGASVVRDIKPGHGCDGVSGAEQRLAVVRAALPESIKFYRSVA